ncbi:MAG: DUF5659 domain-containing protein [Nitrosotalea sp.]
MIRELKLSDYFSSFDLALSATLSLWYPLELVDWTENSHKAKFLFKRDEQLDQLIASYWRGELQVNPQAYFNALKTLKGRLYESR